MILNKKKEGLKLILWNVIAIAILISIFGCSSRKVSKLQTKETEQTEIKTEVKTETKVTDNTKIIDTSVSDEIEFIPIDNSKPIIVNGKSYSNVKIKQRNKKNNISTAKSIIVAKNERNTSNLSNKKVKVVEQKQSDKKQSYFWLFWTIFIFLIIALLLVAYWYYRKYGFRLPF